MFACKATNYQDAYYIGTLAAAYAELGDFAHAVEYQEQAQELYKTKRGTRVEGTDLTKSPYRPEDVKDGLDRLALYKAGKPYRSKPKKSTAAPAGNEPPRPTPSKPPE